MRTRTTPVELLVFGSLRYLGRGFTFDDISEATFVDEEVRRRFFHRFIAFGSTVLFEENVKLPQTLDELKDCEHAYHIAGFPGCIGSSDATHIPLKRVKSEIRQDHLGRKLTYTARTYKVTVDHRRRVLSSTTGHPARWADASLARLDPCFKKLNSGGYNHLSFELEREDDDPITINGAYVIVDNGYLNWSTIIPPMKDATTISQAVFSKWLESLQKDVECTFGILKCRWRILKAGVRVHSTAATDQIFLTCCALHNILLNVDGLAEGWENGVPSFWEIDGNGDIGLEDMPRAIQTRHSLVGGVGPVADRINHYIGTDRSRVGGLRNDNDDIGEDDTRPDRLGGIDVGLVFGYGNDDDGLTVNQMKMNELREILIEHFMVVFKKKEIVCPRQLKSSNAPVFHV